MWVGHVWSYLSIFCRPKACGKATSNVSCPLCAGQRQWSKSTLDVDWPLYRPKAMGAGNDRCHLVIVCRTRAMEAIHTQRLSRNAGSPQKTSAEQCACHDKWGQPTSNFNRHCIQAMGDTRRPRLTSVEECAQSTVDASCQSPTSAERRAQATVNGETHDQFNLDNATCCWPMSLSWSIESSADGTC